MIDAARHFALRWTLRTLMRPNRRGGSRLRVGELSLRVPPHVSHPCPLPALNLLSFFHASASCVQPGERALEMGAGAGVWGLLCAQRGAQVTATDLPGVSLQHISEASAALREQRIQLYAGDLFAGLPEGRRFEHIFFNPPFHLAEPRAEWERAYFGGDGGEVLARFLEEAPRWLSERGVVWLCLPDRERDRYQEALEPFRVTRHARRWLPLLGVVRLLSLRHRSAPMAEGERLGVLNPVAESFWHLSRLMNTQSAELLTLRGQLLEAPLKRAIAEVCARHPITSARLHTRGLKRPEWRAGPAEPPPLTCLSLPPGSTGFNEVDGVWRGALPEALRAQVWGTEPLDPQRQSPVRFVLAREGAISHLMIIAPHLCTDAHAGAQLLSELLQAYREGIEAGESPPRFELLAPLSGEEGDPLSLGHLSASRRARLMLRGLARLLRDIFTRGAGVREGRAGAPRAQTLLTVSPQKPAELQRALKAAKGAGLTAHLLFTRALIQRERAARGASSHTLRLADLIALSPLYPEERRARLQRRFDVLVLPHVVNHQLSAPLKRYREDFSEALRRLREGDALAELYRLRFYNLCARLLPIKLMSQLLFKGVLKTSTTTTNPGPVRVPLARCGPHEVLDFINFPQLSPPARLGLIYTTFRGSLRLLVLHDEAVMSHEEAARFADELWAEVMKISEELERGAHKSDYPEA